MQIEKCKRTEATLNVKVVHAAQWIIVFELLNSEVTFGTAQCMALTRDYDSSERFMWFGLNFVDNLKFDSCIGQAKLIYLELSDPKHALT